LRGRGLQVGGGAKITPLGGKLLEAVRLSGGGKWVGGVSALFLERRGCFKNWGGKRYNSVRS